jgi:hypothetical protein
MKRFNDGIIIEFRIEEPQLKAEELKESSVIQLSLDLRVQDETQ